MPPKRGQAQKKQKKAVRGPRPYTAPVAISRSVVSSKPRTTTKKDSVIITHKEMFGRVAHAAGAANTFLVESYAVNPGNVLMFPWLSTQALSWERYKFHKLVVKYVPRCPTYALGTLILSPDYDAADEAPTGEAQACSYADAISSAFWAPTTLNMRKEPLLGGSSSKYVRSGALKPNLDVKMYDSANLNVCMDVGLNTEEILGKLWVEYTVELITPHTIPTPLTSTFAGTYPNTGGTVGIPDTHPFITTKAPGAVNEQAGPITVEPAMRSPYQNAAQNATQAVDIKGLVTGAQYLVQTLLESGGNSTYTTTATPIVEGLQLIADTISYPYTYTSGAANRKSVTSEGIYRALKSVATLKPVWSWAAGTLGATNAIGTQVVVSPIVSDPAWTLL